MRRLRGLIRRYLKSGAPLTSILRRYSRPSRPCRTADSPPPPLGPGFPPTKRPRYFILLTETAGGKRRQRKPAPPSPRRGRCNLSRNHFYRGVISPPKARTRLRPCEPRRVGGEHVSCFPKSDKSETALSKNVIPALRRGCRLRIASRCNLLYLEEHAVLKYSLMQSLSDPSPV